MQTTNILYACRALYQNKYGLAWLPALAGIGGGQRLSAKYNS
jgi:hypothetical protein